MASDECWCETCRPNRQRMIVCPQCGNKRCPRATHHDNPCTGSNEPGQRGSSWETDPMTAPAPKPDGVDVDELERHYRGSLEPASRFGPNAKVVSEIGVRAAILNATRELIAERDALRAKLAAMVHDRDCWMRKAAEQQTRTMMVQRERDRALATPGAGTGGGAGADAEGTG